MRQKKQQRSLTQGRRRRTDRKKRTGWSAYKCLVVVILCFGGLFLGIKLYELWLIHQDMQETIRMEQRLTEENQRLHDEKDRLSSPDEIMRQAREQFGLAKPGEIPYRR